MRTATLRLVLATLALVSCLGEAEAQTSPVMAYAVPTCGQVTGLKLNEPHLLYMDQTGNLCTSGSGGSGGTTDTVVKSTPTSRSGTVTAGGAAQVLMPANPSRRGFTFQNQSTGDLYINELGVAAADQTSLKVPAGGYFTPPPQQSSTGAVSVFGAVTGQAFFAREF